MFYEKIYPRNNHSTDGMGRVSWPVLWLASRSAPPWVCYWPRTRAKTPGA